MVEVRLANMPRRKAKSDGRISMMRGGDTYGPVINSGRETMTCMSLRKLILSATILFTSLYCPVQADAKGGDALVQATDSQPHRQESVATVVDGNGNIIVTGFRNLSNDTNDDYWTIKSAPDGTILWRSWYDRNGGSDRATALVRDSNNDVIVTGYSWNGSDNDVHTIKYSGIDGTVLWEHTYSGLPGGNEVGSSITFDSYSNQIYVGGSIQNSGANKDFLVLKYNNGATGPDNPPTANFTWGGSAGGNDDITWVASIAGSLAATGTTWNGTDFDVMTILYNPDGTVRWQKQYASTGSYPETGRYLQFDASGNVVLAATTANPVDFDIYVAKYGASDGTLQWEQTYNGAFDDEPRGLTVASDGDVYMTGYTWTLAGSNDFYTARYNGTTGARVWQHIYNSGYDNADVSTATGIAVDEAPNGDLYVTGYTVASGNYDYRTIKYKKENGHLLWQRSFNGSTNLNDRTVGIGLAPDNGVYVVGWTDSTAAISTETSVATGGSNGTVVNSGKVWSINQWANYHVMITGGTNAGIERKIVSNTPTTLTVSPDFGSPVSAADGYYIFDKDNYDIHVITYDRGSINPPTNPIAEALSKEADGSYTVRITWEDNSPDETGFIIERKTGELGSWAEVTRVPANSTTYDDTGLIANNYYYYRVKTYRDAEESYPSSEAHALTFLVTYLTPLWQRTYNGGQNMEDYATAIGVGPDDHPVITGRSDSGLVGMFDFYTLKLDRATGGIMWEERYDSMQNEMDNAVCLAVDNNNDTVVSGFSSLFYAPTGGNVHSVFTMKYPAAGPPATWEKQYNGPGGIDDRSTAIASTTDGSNIYVTGYGLNSTGNNDIYLIKYLADGTQAWAITPVDGGRHDYPVGLSLDPQGNILVAGYRQGTRGEVTDLNNFDFYLAKFNPQGVKQWEDSYNPYTSGDARAQGVAVDPAGDVYVAGYATNSSGNRDYYTIKYNGSNGTHIWARDYDGPAHGDDSVVGVRIDPIMGKNPLDGNIVVVGTQTTDSIDNDTDIHTIRYSIDGEVRWEKTLLRPHMTDTAETFTMDGSGYIYIAGDTGSDIDKDVIAVIYDYEGTLLGGTTYNGGYGFDQASSITANHRGEAFIAGYSTNISQNADYLVIKQKNEYMLVPTPFLATPQPDYSRITLSWRENSPGTRFRIEKTMGPATTNSVWDFLTDQPSGITTFNDTGLSSNTQYCYRIEAYLGTLPSREVITCGTTTMPAPVWVSTTGVTTAALTVNWQNQAGNTGYKVERKIGAGTWQTAPNGILAANISTYTDSGLTAGTQYSYRVSANNPGGYSQTSAERVVWTLAPPPTLTSPNVSWATRVDLSWSNVVGETGYRIERKTGSGGSWGTVGSVGVNVITYSDTTATANTQFYYRIVAVNSSGDSTGNEAPAFTKGTAAVLAPVSNSTSANRIDISWTDLPDETAYTLQESSCNIGAIDCSNSFYSGTYWSGWSNIPLAQNVTSYTRTGLTTSYMYRYRLIATLTGGNTTETSAMKGGWTWLLSPNPLTVNPASETSLTLTWADINGETGYEIWRKQGLAGTYAKVGSSNYNVPNYTDTALLQQTEYCYQVKAVNTVSNADMTNPPSTITDEKCLPTPLPAPAFSAPVAVSATQIDLSWGAVSGSTGYEIEKCRYYDPQNPQNGQSYINQAPATGYWVECTTIPKDQNTTTHSDSVTAGNTYRYRVRNSYGTTPVYYSGWSSYAVATSHPPAPVMSTPVATGSTQLTPSWTNVAGETQFRLEWKLRSGEDCSAGTWNPYIAISQNVTSYAHTSLLPATWYCYQITAVNGTKFSPLSAPVSQTTSPPAPVLTLLEVLSENSIKVTWSPVANPTNYRISRKLFPNGAYTVITTVAGTQTDYTDTGLTAGNLYGYKIEAQNSAGFSGFSNEMSTTTKPAAPQISGIPAGNNQIDLSWLSVKGATNYKIERRTSGGTMAEIQNISIPYVEAYCGYPAPRIACQTLSPNKASYSDSTLTVADNYCYQVKAWNASGGDSATSNEYCIKTADLSAPALTGTALNSMKIGLNWSYSPGTCASGPCESPTGFAVEKQLSDNQWQKIKLTDAATFNYTDISGISPNKSYNYRVLAFTGKIDNFESDISSSNWSQQGVNYDSAGAVATNSSIPPINIVDPANGNIKITPNAGGAMMATSSPGGGPAEKYNYSRISLLSPSLSVYGNFDVQIDYHIPEVPLNPVYYHVYGRLQVSLPAGAGTNFVYIERSNGGYTAIITVEGVQTVATLPSTDTAGRLRLTRNGDRISAMVWVAGKWQVLAEKVGTSTTSATGVHFSQYAQRNEAVSLKIIVDNFDTTSNKSAYSPVATVTTPAYTAADGNCP